MGERADTEEWTCGPDIILSLTPTTTIYSVITAIGLYKQSHLELSFLVQLKAS